MVRMVNKAILKTFSQNNIERLRVWDAIPKIILRIWDAIPKFLIDSYL